MKGSLREVIANQLIMNSPPYNPEPIWFLMKLVLSIFQKSIKFDFQFLTIFQVFL